MSTNSTDASKLAVLQKFIELMEKEFPRPNDLASTAFGASVKTELEKILQAKYADGNIGESKQNWVSFFKDVYKEIPHKKLNGASFTKTEKIQDNFLNKLSPNGVPQHLDIALLTYYYSHTTADESINYAAREMDKKILQKPFENRFGGPVPRTLGEANKLIEKQKVRQKVSSTTTIPKIGNRTAISTAILTSILLFVVFFLYFPQADMAVHPPDQKSSVTPKAPGNELFEIAMTSAKDGRERYAHRNLIAANELNHPNAPGELAVAAKIGYGTDIDPEYAKLFADVAVKRRIVERAENGERDAQHTYGLMLLHGAGVEEAPEKGIQYLELALAQGLTRAAAPLSIHLLENNASQDKCSGYELAKIAKDAGHLQGYWTEARFLQDYACPITMGSREEAEIAAISLLGFAAKSGHAESQNTLGVAYRENNGVSEGEQNDAIAERWFEEAAAQGHIEAINNLGSMLVAGKNLAPSAEKDEKAVGLFRRTALKGDASGQRNLGWMYEHGRGVPEDHAEAVSWYQKAVDQEYAKAQTSLGWMYEKGMGGVPEDDFEAARLFKKAADQDYDRGQYALGWMYQNGRGIPETQDNDAEAVSWYRKAADQDYDRGQFALGWMYYSNRGVPKSDDNHIMALAWFQKAADQGYAAGQSNVGAMYELGEGVEKDTVKAVEWYRKAAKQKYAQAQVNLGWSYQENRGVPAGDDNDTIAVSLFKKAADQNFEGGQYSLGWMYEHGLGVPGGKDSIKAVEWYRRAADQEHARAQTNLGWMYAEDRGMPENEDNDVEAVSWFQKAANQDFDRGQYSLGWMYEYGRGVPESNTKALSWYEKAAVQDHVSAQYNLGKMYAEGRGVPKNAENDVNAIDWFDKALGQGDGRMLATFARWYALDYHDEQFGQLARDHLNALIEQDEKDGLNELLGDTPWEAFASETLDSSDAGQTLCYNNSVIWCFGFNEQDLVAKLERISSIGVYEVSLGLADYFYFKNECDKANTHLKLARENSPADQSRYYEDLTDFYLRSDPTLCKKEIDEAEMINGILEAATNGSWEAGYLIKSLSRHSSKTIAENYPALITKLEIASIEKKSAGLWELVGDIYASGAPRIPKQPQKSEMWYKKVLETGSSETLYELKMLYLNNFSPPRISDAIDLITAHYDASETVEQLGYLLPEVDDQSPKNVLITERIVAKLEEMSGAGVWQANFALIKYFEDTEKCVEANHYLDLASSVALNSKVELTLELARLIDGNPDRDFCELEIDEAAVVGGLFEALLDGGSWEAKYLLTSLSQHSSNALIDIYPRWVTKLEINSIEENNSKLWAFLGDIYADGAPGIPNQPQKSVIWYEKALSDEYDDYFVILNLSALYIFDFTPPRVHEAVELLSRRGSSYEIVQDLEELISNSIFSDNPRRSIIEKQIAQAIADIKAQNLTKSLSVN